jgi:hypothetical protein
VLDINEKLSSLMLQFKMNIDASQLENTYHQTLKYLSVLTKSSVESKETNKLHKMDAIVEPEQEQMISEKKNLDPEEQDYDMDIYHERLFRKRGVRMSEMKQNIIRGTGLLNTLLELLYTSLRNPLKTGVMLMMELQAQTFSYLTYAIDGNQENQYIALANMDLYFDFTLGSGLTVESLLFFLHVIKNNSKILYDEDISFRIMKLVVINQNLITDPQDPILIISMNILAEFCRINNNPIKRNQIRIFKNFIENGTLA